MKLKEAAYQVFLEKGYKETNISEIAKRSWNRSWVIL
ncbi:MAG: TetR family transcriptional regulator [Muricomes sp.]